MRIGIDPLIDCVFKWLFGTERNKNLLLDMINAVLRESRQPQLVAVEIINPYNPKFFLQDKLSIVDVKAKSETGEHYIVEVQMEMAAYFPKRLLYYWARNYQSQLHESEQYHKLEKVTLICVSRKSLPIATTHYYSHFQVVEKNAGLALCDDLQIHTIELSKFMAGGDEVATPLESWAYFFKHGEELDDRVLPQPLTVPVIQQAVKELTVFTQDQEQRELYEARRKATLDFNSMMVEKELIGIKKGEELGIKKGRLEGEELGIKKGKIEGKIEAIETALEIKFGAVWLTLLPQIEKIHDLEQLSKIHQLVKKATDWQECLSGLTLLLEE